MMKTATVFFLLVFVPGPALAAVQKSSLPAEAAVINAVENMHSNSRASSDVISQAILGTNVRILKKERNSDGEDWFYVETPDTYKGWIISSALEFMKPGGKSYGASGKIFVVMALLANTYREPDITKHKPVKVAPISTVLEVVGERDARWLEVNLPCGTKAWIQKGDGEIQEAPWSWPRQPPEEMVALSKRFLGLPYFWGGTSPLGFDCSGFSQLVYKMGGIPLLRDSSMQFAQTDLTAVPAEEEAAGDLVFFGRAKDRISHVGMMVNGEEFISATTWQKPIVQISRLDEPHWKEIYQGARRQKK